MKVFTWSRHHALRAAYHADTRAATLAFGRRRAASSRRGLDRRLRPAGPSLAGHPSVDVYLYAISFNMKQQVFLQGVAYGTVSAYLMLPAGSTAWRCG